MASFRPPERLSPVLEKSEPSAPPRDCQAPTIPVTMATPPLVRMAKYFSFIRTRHLGRDPLQFTGPLIRMAWARRALVLPRLSKLQTSAVLISSPRNQDAPLTSRLASHGIALADPITDACTLSTCPNSRRKATIPT